MRAVGIVAEYNPFHTGHEYQIRKAKELTDADYAIAVLSPDFVQRGEPAIFDKYTRTQMALTAGADLVIELPVCYATGSAEYFAEGAIQMLEGLGVTDTLCFGAEPVESKIPDIRLFEQTAQLLLQEPPLYKKELRQGLEDGLTFPKARAKALGRYQNVDGLLSSPNNILGVEYCKAILKFHSRMTPVALKREGSGYSSEEFDGKFCSATALRKSIREYSVNRFHPSGTGCTAETSAGLPESFSDVGHVSFWESYIPEPVRPLFTKACRTPLFPDDLLPFLTQALIYRDTFDDILDISPDLSRRIRDLRFACIGKSFDETVSLLKTRQMTQTRIRRALLHLILRIQREPVETYRANGTVFYAHVLGFRRNASPLLHEIKKRSAIPFLTKASSAPVLLSGCGLQMWQQDVNASHLYRSLTTSHYGIPFRTEYECSPVVLDERISCLT